jgi:nicotinate-nucleotide adenylyltransferase
MPIGVYGGSFDPPHVAHVLCAHYVLSVGVVDRVIVVPVYRHALEKKLSPFGVRVEMCRRAFASDPRISISTIEEELPCPSYTLHTLEALQQHFPGESFRLMIGADVLSETARWHRFDEVEKLAPLLVLGRIGFEDAEAPSPVLPAVSSTEIRRLFRDTATEKDRERRDMLIPASVREVIEEQGLYRAP